MAVFKCKMCSGTLDITAGATVVQCDYCGTTQTVPNADDEKKIALFTRANRLRAGNEFDKASGIYESIVADFPEEAEAYWGLVLCKYGVEYVDDPATGNKIPTCHRSSFESVMDDNNFELTLEYADAFAKRVYREEAKQLEEIRKGIIAVSSKEEPYDIFICYKETDEHGDRTIDSVLAQDIYDVLTEKGYRTFFARITLEDKLGQEYEPYIFAALNTAKIMLAVGTSFEHYDAVWVKNEWSRYLKLMTSDKSKYLIPCYKGIDAYDMPKEFAKLQAQDLGKVGATQDLLRGIEKILPKQKAETEKEVVKKSEPTGRSSELSNLYLLARRAKNTKNDEDAQKYYDMILIKDPTSWEATFYSVFYQALKCKVNSMPSAIGKIENTLPSVIALVKNNVANKADRKAVFDEMAVRLCQITEIFCNQNITDNNYKREVLITSCNLNSNFMGELQKAFENNEFIDAEVTCLKQAVRLLSKVINSIPSENNERVRKIYFDWVTFIQKYELNFTAPVIPEFTSEQLAQQEQERREQLAQQEQERREQLAQQEQERQQKIAELNKQEAAKNAKKSVVKTVVIIAIIISLIILLILLFPIIMDLIGAVLGVIVGGFFKLIESIIDSIFGVCVKF